VIPVTFIGSSVFQLNIAFADGENPSNSSNPSSNSNQSKQKIRVPSIPFYKKEYSASGPDNVTPDFRVHQPSFSATAVRSKPRGTAVGVKSSEITLESLKLISGSSNPELAQAVSEFINVPIGPSSISRFADGEVAIQLNENIRGKDVFIIQSCTAPVNDSIMELLLTVSCCRRSSARRIVAVIPYFGYKHHRRTSNISLSHHSRFLTSSAGDFAEMLQELGVDRVISVDLQRPGQGLEACFFDNMIPVETVLTTNAFIQYLLNRDNGLKLKEPLTIIAPNAEVYKKAKKFQKELQRQMKQKIELIPYFSIDSGSGPSAVEPLTDSTSTSQVSIS
jgi:hypothetical protein